MLLMTHFKYNFNYIVNCLLHCFTLFSDNKRYFLLLRGLTFHDIILSILICCHMQTSSHIGFIFYLLCEDGVNDLSLFYLEAQLIQYYLSMYCIFFGMLHWKFSSLKWSKNAQVCVWTAHSFGHCHGSRNMAPGNLVWCMSNFVFFLQY